MEIKITNNAKRKNLSIKQNNKMKKVTVNAIKADQLEVYPINTEKLSNLLKRSILNVDPYTSYKPKESLALVKDTGYKAAVLTDNECTYQTIMLGPNFELGTLALTLKIPLYKHSINEDGNQTFGIFPIFDFFITVDSLKKEEILEEAISLKEFMGSRFEYNTRVKNNTDNLLRLFKQR